MKKITAQLISLILLAVGIPSISNSQPVGNLAETAERLSTPDEIHISNFNSQGPASRIYEPGVQHLSFDPYVFKPIINSAFAYADLSTAQLKSRIATEIGPDVTVGSPQSYPIQERGFKLYSGAFSQFSDNFFAIAKNSEKTPFSWASDTSVIFSFSVDGSTTYSAILATLPAKYVFIQSQLEFEVHSLNGEFGYGEIIGLGSNAINNGYVPDSVVNVQDKIPTVINRSFMPGGDFFWSLGLSVEAELDGEIQNVFANLNFGDTVSVSYTGPAGAETFSASGLFPGTQAFTSAVPESETWVLLLVGLGVMGTTVRRQCD